MDFNDLRVGTLLRRKNPYTGEGFHMVTQLYARECLATEVSGKFGFNCNHCLNGELIDDHSICWYEVVSIPKMVWLVFVGIVVNVVKGKKRNSK